MPINFGILQPTQAAQTQVVATPQQSGGGDGLGGMLGGLQSLFGGIKGSFGANPVSTANQAVQMTMDKTPAAAISQSILPSSLTQGQNNISSTGGALGRINNMQGQESPIQSPEQLANTALTKPTQYMQNPLQSPNITGTALNRYNTSNPGFSTPIMSPANQAASALSIPGIQQLSRQAFPNNPVMQQVMTAQATQESGLLGTPSKLATQQNNLFGMTGKGTAGSVKLTGNLDSTPQQFAAYNNPQESAAAYSNLMQNNPRYKDVLNAPDFNTAMKELQKSGYATDPNYTTNLKQINQKINDGSALSATETNKQGGGSYQQLSQNVHNPQAQVQAIHNAVQASSQPNATPFSTAQAYLGKSAKHDANVLSGFFQKSGMGKVDPRNTPWCAAFANSVMMSNGIAGTGSLSARSFLHWGTPTKTPTQGDIVVTSDLTGRNDPAHGHVGLFAGMSEDGTKVKILGGNESGQVMIKEYPASKVIGYRTPPTAGELQAGANQQNQQSQLPIQNIPSVGIQAPQYQQAGLLSGGQNQQKQNNQKPGQQQQSQPGQGSQYNSGQNQFNLLNARFQ